MNSIKKNFIYNFTYQILLIILPLITAPYISRILGSEGIGLYSYTYSVAYYFMIFAKLGLDNYGNRSIAQSRDDKVLLSKTFWSIYGMQVITSGMVIVVYLVYALFFEKNHTIAIIQGCYVISSLLDINWFFFGIEEFKLTVMRNAIIKLIVILCIFIFIKSKSDLMLYIFIMAGGVLLSQIILWNFLIKHVVFIKPTWKDIKKHFKPNAILFIPIIVVSFYKIMDKIILADISSMSELGFYENSEKIINLFMSAITALGTVMLPRMSNLVISGDKVNEKIMIEKSMIFIMLLSSAFMFGIAGIAPVLAPIFFGNEFIKCGLLISLLSIIIIFISWANVIRTQYVIPHSKDNIYIITSIAGSIVNFIFIYLLIPSMGAMGAVIGTIIAEATVCISQTFMVRKEIDIKKYLKNSYMFIVFGMIMFLIVRLIGRLKPISVSLLLVQILVGTAAYIIMVFIYCLKTKSTLITNNFKPIIKYFYKS